jgi:hypothetical protein
MIDNFGFPPIILCESELNKDIKETSKERLFSDSDIKMRRIFAVNKTFLIKETNKSEDEIQEMDL